MIICILFLFIFVRSQPPTGWADYFGSSSFVTSPHTCSSIQSNLVYGHPGCSVAEGRVCLNGNPACQIPTCYSATRATTSQNVACPSPPNPSTFECNPQCYGGGICRQTLYSTPGDCVYYWVNADIRTDKEIDPACAFTEFGITYNFFRYGSAGCTSTCNGVVVTHAQNINSHFAHPGCDSGGGDCSVQEGNPMGGYCHYYCNGIDQVNNAYNHTGCLGYGRCRSSGCLYTCNSINFGLVDNHPGCTGLNKACGANGVCVSRCNNVNTGYGQQSSGCTFTHGISGLTPATFTQGNCYGNNNCTWTCNGINSISPLNHPGCGGVGHCNPGVGTDGTCYVKCGTFWSANNTSNAFCRTNFNGQPHYGRCIGNDICITKCQGVEAQTGYLHPGCAKTVGGFCEDSTGFCWNQCNTWVHDYEISLPTSTSEYYIYINTIQDSSFAFQSFGSSSSPTKNALMSLTNPLPYVIPTGICKNDLFYLLCENIEISAINAYTINGQACIGNNTVFPIRVNGVYCSDGKVIVGESFDGVRFYSCQYFCNGKSSSVSENHPGCSGNGYCLSPPFNTSTNTYQLGTCTCDTNSLSLNYEWMGPDCSVPDCNDCSGHGSCTSQNDFMLCSCATGYKGFHCNLCDDGYYKNSIGNCSILPICPLGFIYTPNSLGYDVTCALQIDTCDLTCPQGDFCAFVNYAKICVTNPCPSGEIKNYLGVCSQLPPCTYGYNIVESGLGFSIECIIPQICNMACTENSVCVFTETEMECRCNDGYYLDVIHNVCKEVYKCFGFFATDSGVCGGDGKCIFHDTCQCNYGYRELIDTPGVCEKITCNEIGFDENPCGQGYCQIQGDFIGQCACNQGWYFDSQGFCTIPICQGLLATDPTVCSSNGTCNSPDNCQCNYGWQGDSCEIPNCYEACNQQEQCVFQNGIVSCVCEIGFTGDRCQNAECPISCNKPHMTCYWPYQCTCENGYYFNGAICEPICSNCDQVYGICKSPNVCECPVGFLSGSDESDRMICIPQCSNCSITQTCFYPEQHLCGCVDCQGDCRHCNISDPLDIPVCTVPEYCACKGGYSYINGECIQLCSPECNAITQECQRINEVGVCVCRDGYSGPTCQPDCPECGNNQECSLPNHCTCLIGYYNSSGECLPDCSSANLGQGCRIHQRCISPGLCDCNDPWFGTNCEIPNCALVCNNNENCAFRNGSFACECNTNWLGPDCSIPRCEGCGVHETCHLPLKCVCEEGYYNTSQGCKPICGNCDHLHGTCISPGVCECDQGTIGDGTTCLPVCDPICGQLEKCTYPNTCICKDGYTYNPNTLACETSCPPLGCGPNEVCEVVVLNGNLVAECECKPDYFFDTTSQTCKPGCSPYTCLANEYCIAPDLCDCKPGYYWDSVSCQPACLNVTCSTQFPVGHLTCIAPETCGCSSQWTGIDCQTPICSPPCKQGHEFCGTDLMCHCSTGWSGVGCTTPVCLPDCISSNHKTCVRPGVCVCEAGYYEDNTGSCNLLFTCDGIYSNDENVCSGHGNCISQDVCSCEIGFELVGGTCIYIECNGIQWNTPTICSSNGICDLETKTCFCASGWEGVNCEIPQCGLGFTLVGSACVPIKCNGKDWNDPTVCSGNGQCNVANSLCACSTGWNGINCEISSLCENQTIYVKNCTEEITALNTCNSEKNVCIGDLTTCGENLDNCNIDKTICNNDKNNCNGNLTICNNDKTNLSGNLTICNTDKNTCNGNLIICNTDKATCNTDKNNCNGNLTICNNDKNNCNGNLTICNNDKATCNTDKNNCNGNLTICNTEKETCIQNSEDLEASLMACDSNLQNCQDSNTLCNTNLIACTAGWYLCNNTLKTCNKSVPCNTTIPCNTTAPCNATQTGFTCNGINWPTPVRHPGCNKGKGDCIEGVCYYKCKNNRSKREDISDYCRLSYKKRIFNGYCVGENECEYKCNGNNALVLLQNFDFDDHLRSNFLNILDSDITFNLTSLDGLLECTPCVTTISTYDAPFVIVFIILLLIIIFGIFVLSIIISCIGSPRARQSEIPLLNPRVEFGGKFYN
jgi:hypothetical protein